jgi:hypothetical protein
MARMRDPNLLHGTCMICDKKGHGSAECRKAICDGYGLTGHVVKDYPTLEKVKCYKCNREGHILENCPGIQIVNMEPGKDIPRDVNTEPATTVQLSQL